MTSAVVEVSDVSKAFPGVQALANVDFALRPGEIHALLGENGAGKSTLIKILTGIHLPDSGEVRLHGEAVGFNNARAAIKAGISAVHQERNLIPRMSVGENIMLESLPARAGFVDYGEVERRARRWLDRLGLVAYGPALVGLAELCDIAIEGCRKQQCLAIVARLVEDAPHRR